MKQASGRVAVKLKEDPLLKNDDLVQLAKGKLPMEYMRACTKAEQHAGVMCSVADGCQIFTQHWHCAEHPSFVPSKTADAVKHSRLHFKEASRDRKAAERIVLKGRMTAAPRGVSSSRSRDPSVSQPRAREAHFTAVFSPILEPPSSGPIGPCISPVQPPGTDTSSYFLRTGPSGDLQAHHMVTIWNSSEDILESIMLKMDYIPATDYIVNTICGSIEVEGTIVRIEKEGNAAHETLLRIMFKKSTDHHALQRISSGIGLGASITLEFHVDAVQHWEQTSIVPDDDALPQYSKAQFGKKVETCCRLIQMSHVNGAMAPCTNGSLSGDLGSTAAATGNAGVNMRRILDAMSPTAYIGITLSGGLEWSPPGYRPRGFVARDMYGVDVTGPFQVHARLYVKIDDGPFSILH